MTPVDTIFFLLLLFLEPLPLHGFLFLISAASALVASGKNKTLACCEAVNKASKEKRRHEMKKGNPYALIPLCEHNT